MLHSTCVCVCFYRSLNDANSLLWKCITESLSKAFGLIYCRLHPFRLIAVSIRWTEKFRTAENCPDQILSQSTWRRLRTRSKSAAHWALIRETHSTDSTGMTVSHRVDILKYRLMQNLVDKIHHLLRLFVLLAATSFLLKFDAY